MIKSSEKPINTLIQEQQLNSLDLRLNFFYKTQLPILKILYIFQSISFLVSAIISFVNDTLPMWTSIYYILSPPILLISYRVILKSNILYQYMINFTNIILILPYIQLPMTQKIDNFSGTLILFSISIFLIITITSNTSSITSSFLLFILIIQFIIEFADTKFMISAIYIAILIIITSIQKNKKQNRFFIKLENQIFQYKYALDNSNASAALLKYKRDSNELQLIVENE